MGFESLLRLMQAGDPLKAAGVRAPLQTLQGNVNYLYEWLRAAGVGATVYAHRETVDPTLPTGTPVWYNSTSGRFEAGFATTVAEPLSGVILTSPSAQVWGIIANKIQANCADILLWGFDKVDISAAVDGPVTAGVYYLSGSAPGKLTQQKPPISVAVLRATGDGRVLVMPQFIDFLDRHTHYRFPLACLPAGQTSEPAPGGRHIITSADVSQPGWLPANHASFNGLAPRGAAFGYNFAEDPGLANTWPPIPINPVYLDWDKGLDPAIGSTGVPLGPEGLCVVDANGIWWMSNCYGDVPWPLTLNTSDPTSDSMSQSSTPECPRDLEMALTLWFTKVNFATDLTTVLSLRSRDPRIQVFCAGTNKPGSAGNLELALNLALQVTTGQLGYIAIKCFDPKTSIYKSGPVTEGVYALSPNVRLTGDLVGPRTIQGVAYNVYQGLVGISVLPEPTAELDVQLVRLGGCTEENFEDILYLGMIQGVLRALRGQINVPTTLAIPNPQMTLAFTILGRSAGTLPQLTFTARRVPRAPAGLTTPLSLPDDTEEFTVTCPTIVTLADDNLYVEAQSTPFTVTPGDTVYFTVQRDGTDAYDAEVGIVRQFGLVSSGPGPSDS